MQSRFPNPLPTLATVGRWEFTPADNLLVWDAATRNIYGVPEDYVPDLARFVDFLLAPQDREQWRRHMDEAIGTGSPYICRFEIATPAGIIKWVEWQATAQQADGQTTKLTGTCTDLTAKRNLGELLRRSETQFRQTFDFAPIGMALLSPQGRWMKVNRSLCQLTGYSETEMTSLTFRELTHPDDAGADRLHLEQLLQGKADTYRLEKRYIHQDGHPVWGMTNVSLVRSEDGAPLHFVLQVQDISEQKTAEQERRKAMQVVEEQNKRLLNFAHIVSHNLRSHAGNFRLMLDLLTQETTTDAERTDILSMLTVNAANLEDTIHNLNEVVQIHTTLNPQNKRLNLYQEVQRAVQSVQALLTETAGTVDLDIPPDLWLESNPAYMESILLNFLTNAIKYRHPERPPLVRFTAVVEKDFLRLDISDNGLGIDLQVHGKKLFGMYKTFHRNRDARGIGLFITKSQVEALGGRIEVDSEVGVGSTFRLYLPTGA